MRHDDTKILGFGLLALAAVLVIKNRKPGIGRISKEQRKRIDDAYKGLKRYYERKYRNGKERKPSTNSKYFEFRAGNTKGIIRNGDHRGYNGRKEYAYRIEADLINLTKGKESTEQVYEKVKYAINRDIAYFNQ